MFVTIFPCEIMIVHKLLLFLISRIWSYPVFKSSDISNWKPFNFNSIPLVFGMGCDSRFNWLFKFLKSLIKRTWFDLGLGCVKYWDLHYGSFNSSRTRNRNKLPTYFLDISLCNFGTWCGRKLIGLVFSFNFKFNISVFRVPSVPSNRSSNLCNTFSNSLHCASVRCWNYFSYPYVNLPFCLSSNITHNCLVSFCTC